ncbi:hypothetical protein HDU96_004596, partial [Phlyctochytrium bullatum]
MVQSLKRAYSAESIGSSTPSGTYSESEISGSTRNSKSARQASIDESFETAKIPMTTKIALDRELTLFFVTGSIPFRQLHNAHFRRFMNLARPKYQIPTRDTVRTELIPRSAEFVELETARELKSSQFNTIITDGWEDATGKHVVGWLAINDCRKNYLIALEHKPVTQRTVDLHLDFAAVLEKLDSDITIHGVTTDSGGPYVKFRKELKLHYPKLLVGPCLAHQSNLLVKDFLKIEEVDRVITQAL